MDEAPLLEPQVDVGCVVCGSREHTRVSTIEEVQAQLAYSRRFHRRRLRLAGGERDQALADRAEFTQDYATEIVRCSRCDLVYRESRPRAEAIAAAYAKDRYGSERLASLYDSQLELSRAKVEQLRPFLPQAQPTVVEVGSFVGGFLAAARERGWNAIGVDPGEEVTAFCRERGLEVMRSSAADAPIAAGTADCVAIWNTFDQLPNPRPTLAAVRRWLRPRGLLVLRVPNGACYRVLNRALRRASPRWRRPLLAAMAWNNLLAFPYLWGYSPTSLDSLLAANGFDRIHLQPDTLTRLADETTKRWAVWEERLCKASWRAMARWKADTAPWFDAIYRIR